MDVSNRKSETAMNKNAMEREARRRLTREKIFDDMMECIAEETLDEFAENLPPLDAPKPFETSDEYKKNIEMLIKGERKKEKHKIYMRRFVKVAAGMVICCGVLTATVLNVSAFRNPLFNFIVEHKEKYSQVQLEEVNNEKPENKDDQRNFLNKYPNIKLPTYLPEGFSYVNTKGDNEMYTSCYVGTEGEQIQIDQRPIEGKTFFDNEHGKSEIIDDHGIQYFVMSDEEQVHIYWEKNEITFYISGNITKQEVLKVAKNIK